MNLLSIADLTEKEIHDLINLGIKIKKSPNKYRKKLKNKSLLMLFAKPSLRTHLSFDLAMTQLGGHPIFYNLENSPLGKKESIKDGARVISRYVDIIMARLYEHSEMQELAQFSSVPVINGLDNLEHPAQILGDLMTIKEKLGTIENFKMAYLGDANNNITHSLMLAAWKLGFELNIACPKEKEFMPLKEILDKTKTKITTINDAVKNSGIIYTDTYMSYHIPASQEKRRLKILKPFQVNSKIMSLSKKALFMHCLPAKRGDEVTDEVMDSKRSIIYDQAENRLHIQKAILLRALK